MTKLTSSMNDPAINDHYSVVSEVYDLLHPNNDYIHQTVEGGNMYTINRPSEHSTLREVRFRSFNPIIKSGRSNYEDVYMNITVKPYIISSFNSPTYFPGYQLYVDSMPFVSKSYLCKFGTTKENTTRNIMDCIRANLPVINKTTTLRFYNPNSTTTDIYEATYEWHDVISVEYSSDGVLVTCQPLALVSGSNNVYLQFCIEISTGSWFIFSITPDDIIELWRSSYNGNYTAQYSGVVGRYISNFEEAYDIIKSVTRGDRLVLLCNQFNNLSQRVYVEGDSFNSGISKYKYTETQPSTNYIQLILSTLREQSNEKNNDYVIYSLLDSLYDAVIVELDWVYERL